MDNEDWENDEMFKAGNYGSPEGDHNEGIVREEIEPEISIHALYGSPSPKTMRIMGQIGKRVVIILIDTGNTHNFIDPSIIQGAQLAYGPGERMKVKVANGQSIRYEGRSKAVPLNMQGNVYTLDFFILTLRGYYVV